MAKDESSIGFGSAGNSPRKKKDGRGDPARVAKYKWPKGKSGNPSGRPKKKHFDLIFEQLASANPEAVRAIGVHLFEAAQGNVPFCTGAVVAAKFLTERVDGKVAQPISGPEGGPIEVVHGTSDQNTTRITDLYARAIERVNRRGTLGTGKEIIEGGSL